MPHRSRSCQHLEHSIQFAGHTTTVNGLSCSTVTAYIAQLEQDKYTAATIRRRIVTLRLFCDFWTQKGELKESPFWRLKFRQPEPRTPDPIETPQLRKPLSHAIQSIRVLANQTGSDTLDPKRLRASRDLAILAFLIATGMRPSEMRALSTKDVLATNAVRIKGRYGQRIVPFSKRYQYVS